MLREYADACTNLVLSALSASDAGIHIASATVHALLICSCINYLCQVASRLQDRLEEGDCFVWL